jgi:hypothetical protein
MSCSRPSRAAPGRRAPERAVAKERVNFLYATRTLAEGNMQSTAGQEEHSMGRRGVIFVLSAPSGAGKTSLSKRIVAEMPDVVQVVTCTTRAPRPEEQDGREYHFLSRQA